MDFHGAKIALLQGDAVLTIQRDDIPTIPFPGLWDLPGGGREAAESPEACVLRELSEELGLSLGTDRLIWRQHYPGVAERPRPGYLFAARITEADLAAIRFGDEGQGWRMMPTGAFLAHPRAVPFLKPRLRACLRALHG